MRKILIFILIGLFLGVSAIALVEIDPGYMLIAIGNWTLETSFWVGCALLLLLYSLAYMVWWLWKKFWGSRRSFSGWRKSRNAERAARFTNRGLINFIEGNWSKSRQQLLRGAKGNDAPLLNYLMAARASNELNEPARVREYLVQAESAGKGAGIAVELIEAEMKLARGQYEQALATLVEARNNASRHPGVMSLLHRAYTGLNDWQELANLLPDLRKHKILPESKLSALEYAISEALLQRSAAKGELAGLQQCWQGLSADMKKKGDLAALYCHALIVLEEHDEACKFIVRHTKRDWNSKLVRLYGLARGSDAAKQLSQAESWLDGEREDAQLYLCLGRLCARNELWGKARDYFEMHYKLDSGPEICAELGRLLASLGEDKVSAAYFREGLLQTESALPELPMPDKAVSRVGRLANS